MVPISETPGCPQVDHKQALIVPNDLRITALSAVDQITS